MRCTFPSALVVALVLVSCGTTISNPRFPNATHELATSCELYRGGPQQSRPADLRLEAGTLVRVIETAGSYTLIELENRDGGYVLTSALLPLEPR
ncbi:MAG: hypothetical protein JNM84_04690 [Planctomycetes bacterium]|nr:hypothetical protein [Planctomycetota bacterium]